MADHYVHLFELHTQHQRFAEMWNRNLRQQGFAEAFYPHSTYAANPLPATSGCRVPRPLHPSQNQRPNQQPEPPSSSKAGVLESPLPFAPTTIAPSTIHKQLLGWQQQTPHPPWPPPRNRRSKKRHLKESSSTSSSESSTRRNRSAGPRLGGLEEEQRAQEYEAEQARREEQRTVREATFERILENTPATLSAAQLRVLLRAIVNLDRTPSPMIWLKTSRVYYERRSPEELLLATHRRNGRRQAYPLRRAACPLRTRRHRARERARLPHRGRCRLHPSAKEGEGIEEWEGAGRSVQAQDSGEETENSKEADRSLYPDRESACWLPHPFREGGRRCSSSATNSRSSSG